MTIDSLEKLFLHELKDIYDAEKRLIRALPKMAKASGSEELRDLFRQHLEETKTQLGRLDQIFEAVGQKAAGKTCLGMKGLIEEGEETAGEQASEPSLSDIALITAARKVEHYEISAYRSLQALADAIGGEEKIVELIQENLDEEEQAESSLSELCEALIEEVQGGGEEEDDEEMVSEDESDEDEELEDEEEEESAKPAPARQR